MPDNSNQTGNFKLDFFLSAYVLFITWINGINVIEMATKYEPIFRMCGTVLSVYFAWRGLKKSAKKRS